MKLSMLNAHFFKANSRIGIINKPNHQKKFNIGVEEAPDFLLDKTLLGQVKKYSLSTFNFPTPENLTDLEYKKALAKTITNFKKFLLKQLGSNERQIVIGGDHCVTLSSVLAIIERIKNPKKLGYIHFDSHGDSNLYIESPSKNFHGMYLRPLMDNFDIPEINSLVTNKLPTENMLFIGNIDFDEGELRFFKEKNIQAISRDALLKNRERIKKVFKKFVESFEYLHLSFDVDVFDQSVLKATGIPAKNGFMLEDILIFLEIAATHRNLTFDITEFNPQKSGAQKSKTVVQKVITTLLK